MPVSEPAATRDPESGRVVLSARAPAGPWSRTLNARAARILWDGLTTALFAGAGEKFVRAAQTALFKPDADPALTDWVHVTREPSGLIAVRGVSTVAPAQQNWAIALSAADGRQLWQALETLLFSQMEARPRSSLRELAAAGPQRRRLALGPDLELACEEHLGPEPALLFVHGAYCDHSLWRYQLTHFAAEHRCVALDMRGHGASSKPHGSYAPEIWAGDLEGALRALGVEHAVAIGQGLGASAVMELAARTARALQAIVLIEPAAIVDDREAELFALLSLGAEQAPGFAERFARRIDELLGEELEPALAGSLRRLMLTTPPHVAAALDEAFFLSATGALAARVRVPALVLLAVHRSEDARFFRRYMPGADVRLLEDISHFPMLVTPGHINALVGEFLQHLGPAPSSP